MSPCRHRKNAKLFFFPGFHFSSAAKFAGSSWWCQWLGREATTATTRGLTTPDHGGGLDGNGIKLLQVFNQLLIFCPDPRFLEGMQIYMYLISNTCSSHERMSRITEDKRDVGIHFRRLLTTIFSLNVTSLKQPTSVSFPLLSLLLYHSSQNSLQHLFFQIGQNGRCDVNRTCREEFTSYNHFQSMRIFHFIANFLHENHPNSHEPSYSRLTGTS